MAAGALEHGDDARRRLAGAERRSGGDALAEVASALREVLAGIPEARCEEADLLLQECDDALYAPAGSGGTPHSEIHSAIHSAIHSRARTLLDAVEDAGR